MAGVIPPLLLQRLQESPSCIRNVCILAHVDHGKTSIADSLVAANGIISSRMVGKLRYMDSRSDEQQRGITMKSSAIALYYKCDDKDYLINLIDSPGHVDFCGEVSTATRVCDSAIIVVDVVEGVCPQTHAVLRQASKEGLRTILVLNKIDRLIMELKMTPLEAYRQLNVVIEQVNSIAGEIFLSEMIDQEESDDQADWNDEAALDAREDRVHFEPSKGNVVFCSAIDGWGFTVADFARILSKKTGMNESVLAKTLWGDFYFDQKAKRIRKGAFDNGKKPIFVQLVLDNIWAVYSAVLVDKDVEKTQKMCESLQITLTARDQRHSDARIRLTAIFHQWLPLAAAVLAAVCRKTPPPTAAVDEARLQALVGAYASSMNPQVRDALIRCDPTAPTVVFVSKMVAVDTKSLPMHRKGPLTMDEIRQRRQEALDKQRSAVIIDETQNSVKDYCPTDAVAEASDHVFIGFARVFCGTIKVGETVYVLPANYTPNNKSANLVQVTVGQLYMFMGRELEQVDSVAAGNLVGIGGLEDVVLKSATLTSSVDCPSLTPLQTYAEPIVRVSIEPKIPGQIDALTKGLKLLNQADPCVRAIIQDTGELVLVTAGEMHLERCLTDLRERYSREVTELIVSEPIIPFLETIVNPPKVDRVNEAIETSKADRQRDQKDSNVTVTTGNKRCHFRIRAVPLPTCVIEAMERRNTVLDILADRHSKLSTKADDSTHLSFGDMLDDIVAFRKELLAAFERAWEDHRGDTTAFWGTLNLHDTLRLVDQIWAFGPLRARHNILFNCIPDYQDRPSVWDETRTGSFRTSDSNVITGFQIRCSQGPLCEEPMRGVGFVVDEWTTDQTTDGVVADADAYGADFGQVIACIKEGCKLAFQAQPQRLMAAMYSCVIRANSDVLGKVYAVLAKRKGRVVLEDMKEGTSVFQISAVLPVIESFGFCDEIRKKTSGLASPQLVFSHWEVVDVDPFWVPTTEEEVTHFGEKADSENQARRYMNAVRRRKGLPTDEQVVTSGEKQRTLNKKK